MKEIAEEYRLKLIEAVAEQDDALMEKYLNGCLLYTSVLDKDDQEIDLKQSFEDDDNMGLQPADSEFEYETAEDGDELKDGFAIEEQEGDEYDDLFNAFEEFGVEDASESENDELL